MKSPGYGVETEPGAEEVSEAKAGAEADREMDLLFVHCPGGG